MENLINTLPAILAAASASPEVVEAACLAAWKHTVGEGLVSHAIPVQLQNRRLVVVVADRIWQRQLEQMRGQLLSRLNRMLGQELVTSIELRIDPKTLTQWLGAREVSKNQRADYQIPLELVTAAAGIEDAHLRRAFLGAAASCVRRTEKS
jgi:hypothetical protein